MKKMIIASAAVALMSVSGAAIAQERVFASADLNVRAGPGTNHRVIGSIGASDSATLLGCAQASNWCRISYRGGEGWVSSRYLSSDGYAYERRGGAAGTATGAATGIVAGAILGGPVGAAIGGVAGGAIGAGADAANDGRRGNAGAATGAATGVVAGALIGGPVGAIAGGIAGGAIGSGADVAAEGGIDRMATGSIVPDVVPPEFLPSNSGNDPAEFAYVRYNGHYLKVETATGKVVNVLR